MRHPRAWTALSLGLPLGLAAGIGSYTFLYAKGGAYLTNDPAACAQCHVMRDHYDGWLASSHRSVAVCNDCHTPPGLLARYLTKASNGFWHSFAFTTGWFPDVLRIRPRNHEVTEAREAAATRSWPRRAVYRGGRSSCSTSSGPRTRTGSTRPRRRRGSWRSRSTTPAAASSRSGTRRPPDASEPEDPGRFRDSCG